jgi:putative transcriptional regulator
MSRQKASKRQVFSELMEGVEAMKAHRGGKLTLRTHVVAVPEIKETPGGDFFVSVRESFHVSRPVWASMLRVSPRTVEKWEQGGQASPLAATFVELVSRYPDTIDRLQTLPRSVSRSRRRITDQRPKALRSRSTAPAKAPLGPAQLHKKYRPKKVRVLFVGEAPPAGGTFFYAGNSQAYRELKKALESHLGNPANFLLAFKERGYFLDDLTMEPMNPAGGRKRGKALTPEVQLLAERMAEYRPELVVSLLKRICPYVADAMSRAGLDPGEQHRVVSFPGNGQQAIFRGEIAELLKLLP